MTPKSFGAISELVIFVLLYNYRLIIFPSKPKSKCLGPFKVTRLFTNGAVKVESKDGQTFKVNGQHLKLYFGECYEILVVEVVYFEDA